MTTATYTIVTPGDGNQRVHRPGCRDITHERRYTQEVCDITVEPTRDAVLAAIWPDQIDDIVQDMQDKLGGVEQATRFALDDCTRATHFLPCCGL